MFLFDNYTLTIQILVSNLSSELFMNDLEEYCIILCLRAYALIEIDNKLIKSS